MHFEIPVASWFELLLAKILGEKFTGRCMDCFVEGYKWKGKIYISKSWTEDI